MNLVGQSAAYLGGRVPQQKPKEGGGGGMLSHLNPMQFMKGKIPGLPEGGIPGVGGPMGGAGAGAAGGEAAAAGGGAELAELAPLLLL